MSGEGPRGGDAPPVRILVVEDRGSLRRLMRRALEEDGFVVAAAESRQEAERLLDEARFDLLLSDLRLPDGSGIDVLRTLRRSGSEAACVILTAFGDVRSAVEAMKLGASDFLEKPVEIDELCRRARELTRGLGAGAATAPAPAVFEVPGAPPLIGAHPSFQAALRLLRKVAPTEGTVLLLGESGTGKELFARALHALSPRSARPFVAMNCAAVPESLLESELFGHQKGAFTGASAQRLGRFEQAEGGTLFLDEIGELAAAVQAKLLRVLEERSFERVGDHVTRHADVRVVAATNVDLQHRVQEGSFRPDLFYRLDVLPIRLPALSERRSDVPLLAEHLLERACRRNRLPARRLAAEALELLSRQQWPGNVRQLSNVVERAAVLADGERLGAADLEAALAVAADTASGPTSSGPVAGDAERTDEEDRTRRELETALREAGGDKREAARLLGVSYRTVQRRIVRFDLEGFPHYRDAAGGPAGE